MSYQVLARKYRPQKFDEVIGQDHVTKTLKNALTMGRIHHAYLFAGARGIGKTTVARILAKALNCERGPGQEPCNECQQCRDITEGSSMDVQEIDGASNTGVDDVREIRERTRYLPSSGRYKIYIIDEVHMLSTSAFNALLKTLEEPPPHVVFIFATTEPHKIPATILSRCQRYDFRRIPPTKTADSLGRIASQEGITIDDDALSLIAREASGSLRDGQSLFDQAIAFGGKTITAKTLQDLLGFLDRKVILDFLDAVVSRQPKKALVLLDEVHQTGADLTQLANSLLEMLRHLLVIKVADTTAVAADLTTDEAKRLGGLAQKAGVEELERMFSIWYVGAEQIARSPFPKILAEVLIVRLCNVAPVQPIADIISRMDELIGSTPPPVSTPSNSPLQREREDSWEAFMRWLVNERPQVASVFHHGQIKRFEKNNVEIEFDAPIYSEMVMEPHRKKQIDELLREFFKRPIQLKVNSIQNGGSNNVKAEHVKRATKEALESNLVRQAADIFDAQVHDVRTHVKEKS